MSVVIRWIQYIHLQPVTVQLIQSRDFQHRAISSSPQNQPSTQHQLYTPSSAGGVQYGADIVGLSLRFDLSSRDPIDLDLGQYATLDELQQRQALLAAIYESGLGFILLKLYRRVGNLRIVLLELPLYNSGIPSQIINLSGFFDGGKLQISNGTVLEWELTQTGSGGLLPGDFVEIWGTAIEEAWIPDPDIVTLYQTVQSLFNTSNNQANTITAAITAHQESLDAILTNQNLLILALRTALESGGGGGGIAPTSGDDLTTMRLTYHPSGSVTYSGQSVTVPTAPPAPFDAIPATLSGIEIKAGFEIVWEKPHNFVSGSFTDEEYFDSYYFKAMSLGGTLKYVPVKRERVRYNDGAREFQFFVWNNISGDWVFYSAY